MNVMPIVRDAPLTNAARQLAERSYYGLVWVDADLMVVGLYGRLVSFVPFGSHLTESLLPFSGLEADILALRNAEPHGVVVIPSVTIITRDGRTPRLNLSAIWSEAEGCYLVIVSRNIDSPDLEVELNRQIRARLIAETDVKTKSLELEMANANLGRANDDLEQFASIISHDLKSPLRELRYLADDTDSALTAGDIIGMRAGLAAMRAQSQRMAQMLSALLAYASVGQKSDAEEEVDTGALLASVVRHLPCPPGLKIQVAGLWPTLVTMAAPLDLVLRNLIDNAISHHDRSTGTIVITASDYCDQFVIAIRDDGPGISPGDQRAIFLPFRTLAPRPDGAGGMGLALVHRTLTAVGGSIRVESGAPETRGTTFTVFWPKTLAGRKKNSVDSAAPGTL
jgi:signal transduction histidine kinase